ncbi:MAG: HAD-IC family P-type ATPase [Solirubrobacteraceae bacterium]
MSVATPAPLASAGLSEAEAARILAERGRPPKPQTSRSYQSIVVANTFTVFNLILAVAGALELIFGNWRDALFVGVLVANTAIGIAQEVRSKRELDRLAALVAPTATVVRDGTSRVVGIDEVVPGDLVRLAAGDQVVADGEVAAADGLLVDESILTGESDPVARRPGERVRSGSFCVEGAGDYVAQAVGEDSYAAQLAGEARAFRHERSPLDRALNSLLIAVVGVMVPLGIILSASLALRDKPLDEAISTAVAGIVQLVPEGLILLASLTAAVSALRMARRGVLAQQLNAIESLASVDVICLDKTGTLTENALRVVATVPAAGGDEAALRAALGDYAASAPARNATLQAVADGLPGTAREVAAQVPFSSRRRWSALELGGRTFVFGAPERFDIGGLAGRAAEDASSGRRVLAFGAADGPLGDADPDAGLPPGTEFLGLVVLAEKLRDEARDTLEYFRREGVEVKIISGDAPATVGAIARDLGLTHDGAALDGRALPDDDDELRVLLRSAQVIGRISPEGKRRVVTALRDDGRYVAMTGDGVNDVPALKLARLGIAQGSGTQMAKAVADLVLVRGDFAAIPELVGQGRQTLRNILRVAKLFLSKSVFGALLIVTIGVSSLDYPFLPRHLSLTSSLTIGIPAFLIALAPSRGEWRPAGFLKGVLRFAVPAGIGLAAGVIGAYLVAVFPADLPTVEARTVAVTVLMAVGLFLVFALEADTARRGAVVAGLCGVLALAYVLALLVPPVRDFFDLATVNARILLLSAGGAALGIGVAALGLRLSGGRGPSAEEPAPPGGPGDASAPAG